jgi:SAM-dependent methyltransferase
VPARLPIAPGGGREDNRQVNTVPDDAEQIALTARIRQCTQALSDDYYATYREWFEHGPRDIPDAEARRVLDIVRDELRRLQAGQSAGRIAATAAATGRLQLLDIVEDVMRHETVSGPLKEELRHFMLDIFPELLPSDSGYRYTQDWFSYHQAMWLTYFGSLAGRPGLRFLEIGSFEGRSACWIAEHLLTGEGSILVCVDPFSGYPDQERNFDHNVNASPDTAHKILKLRGRSCDVLHFLPAEGFDFIYVDGAHAALDVIQDAAEAWKLLKPNGVVVFDDYQSTALPVLSGLAVKPAIDAFLGMMDGHYDLIFKGWQVAIRKH